MILGDLRLVVRPSQQGRAEHELEGQSAAAQQSPQRGLVMPAVGALQQTVDGPPHQQGKHERATDDDQWAQYVLHDSTLTGIGHL